MKRTRVNVLSVINSASNITTETIDGTEHIVVKNICPLYDNCVLNGGLYPTEENDKGYLSLNEVPMPYGHPKIDGKYVSARDVRALNNHWIGAYSLNPRKEGQKVMVDMRINRRIAEGTDHGKEVLARLDAMVNGETTEPISISTGLNLSKIQANGKAPNGKAYTWIATNQQYDHIAILLNEAPAGTPEEGIGMFVNSQGEEMDVEQVNLVDASDCRREGWINKVKHFLTNDAAMSFQDISRALQESIRTTDGNVWRYVNSVYPDNFIYEEESSGTPAKLFKQKYLITDGVVELVGDPVEVKRSPTEYEEVKTNKEQDQMFKDKMIAALNAAGVKTDGLTDDQVWEAYNATKTPEMTDEEKAKAEKEKKAKDEATNSEQAPAWFKPFADDLAAVKSGLTANADQQRTEMRAAVKAKFGMTDLAVNALDGEPLKELFAQCQTSTGLSGAFRQVNNNQTFSEKPE